MGLVEPWRPSRRCHRCLPKWHQEGVRVTQGLSSWQTEPEPDLGESLSSFLRARVCLSHYIPHLAKSGLLQFCSCPHPMNLWQIPTERPHMGWVLRKT